MEFKFNIGDKVTVPSVVDFVLRGIYAKELQTYGDKRYFYPKSMMVIQRRYEECSGGVQVAYLCSVEFEGSRTVAWYSEIELVVYPQEQITKIVFDYFDFRIKSKK